MARDIGIENITEVDSASLEPVVLVELQFATPIYVHSGVGNITYNSNVYTGVGDFGGVHGVEESEELSPAPVTLTLSSLVSDHLTEALNAGNYGDVIIVYQGYRQTGGALVADPWVIARGTFEHATIEMAEENNRVSIIMQHDIAVLRKKSGRRFTDEDQQEEYPGDTGLAFVHFINNVKLRWGGRVVNPSPGGGFGRDIDPDNPDD